MRLVSIGILVFFAQSPTIRTTVPLVVVHTTVTDARGRYIDGLNASDFRLSDDGKLQRIESDTIYEPISLVLVNQTNEIAKAALAKVRKIGPTIEPLVTGERGETAVITYSDQTRLAQPFTFDALAVKQAIAGLRADGSSAKMIDSIMEAIEALESRPANRRRIILIIGESKDRGSKTKLEDALTRAQRSNVLIYSLTYSAYVTPFTAKPQDAGADGGFNILAIFQEIARLGQESTAAAFARYTGGRVLSFLKQKGLEEAISRLGEELHAQYILTFIPRTSDDLYHRIAVSVPGHPDAIVTARPGYWLGE
jgi:VWFA-related protein